MDTNEKMDHESDTEKNGEMITDTIAEQENKEPSSDNSDENGNLDICPNCLEPNTDDLAVCKYCGMPLHRGAEADEYLMKQEEADMEANRAEAAPEEKKPPKKQENGFRRMMPWLGLYLIYYAITGFFQVKSQIQQAIEEGQEVNQALAYGSQVIWLAAGLLMAWPLIMKGYRKLRHLPDPEEEAAEDTETTEQANNSSENIEDKAEEENISVVEQDPNNPANAKNLQPEENADGRENSEPEA